MHEGHRKRILDRLESNETSLQDHELLEILLFEAIPRRNTNGLAHALLAAFGTFHGVLHASIAQLCTVEGIGRATASYLRTLGLVYDRLDGARLAFPDKFNLAAFSDFLSRNYAALTEEVLDIFCLDKSERVRLNKRFASLRSDGVKVTTEEISGFLVKSRCYGIVVAHNHPRSSCRPSREDERFTAQISMLCSMHNIRFYDHLIVGKDGVYSYFSAGRMEKIRDSYNFSKFLGENQLP
ncbi:MAG: hypothetical protein K2H43_04845 [Clostridia bacterium]|nr:hypothetical protein [Clostridia bacterium]